MWETRHKSQSGRAPLVSGFASRTPSPGQAGKPAHSLVSPADSADNAEVALEKKHEGEMLRVALTKLSPEHREIIDLVYYHENSVDDAADILSIPRATVKTRMFYARKKLAELVQAA